MDKIDVLESVFQNYLLEKQSKYIITSKDNIAKLITIFVINNNDNINKSNIDKLVYILKFITESFLIYRANVVIFNFYVSINNNNIFYIIIDFYLYNKYNSPTLDNAILGLLDVIINNIDISKNIIDYIIHKYSYYFYTLDENENKNISNKYKYFYKLLKILIHLLGVNHKQIKPKCYYYLTENNHINISIPRNNTNIGIILWLKYYFNNDKGEIITINFNKNNIIKLYFENEGFIISYNDHNSKIKEKEKIFLSKEWNCICFNYKTIKKKGIINFYLNEKQILKDFCINDKVEKDIFVNYIKIGNNFFGELSTIIITNNNDNLYNLKMHKNLFDSFPYGITHYKYISNFTEKFKDLIPLIKYLYCPYAEKFNLINNIKKDLIFENNEDIKIMNNNINYIHIYKSYFRKIYLIGGIDIFLPIFELFYINIDLCLEHNDLIYLYFDLISVIFKSNKKNMLEAIDHYFFMILSIFIEKLPKELYNNDLLNTFIELGKNIFNENKFCKLYLDYFNHILLNENIFTNFNDELQIKLFQNIYNFFGQSHKIICPINKIVNILFNYDKQYIKGEGICCEDHYNCFIDDYKYIYKNKKINKAGISIITDKIFLLYEGILKFAKEKGKEDRIKPIMDMLALNISPCFIIKILNLLKNIFIDDSYKISNLVKENIFNLINNNEEYKVLIFNLLYNDFIDVKYAVLSLILTIYDYKPKEFLISFKFIKNNILPSGKLKSFNYKNFSPTSNDILILSKHCMDIINNLNTFNIYNHDDIISTSIFNFSYIYSNYTIIINLFVSYLNKNQENIYEILDIIIHINKNLNIELTIEFIKAINIYSIKNNLLIKNIFTFIPLLNYFLDTMLYYSNVDNNINNIFSTLYDFFINMISNIKEKKKKLVIIEYIVKYYSLIKNRGDNSKNKNIILNNAVNNILNKLLTKIAKSTINKNILNDNYQLSINLISILFNYMIVFNQDKSIYNAYLSKNIDAIFPSSENEFDIIIFYLKGLNIEPNIQNNNNDSNDAKLLKYIWKDFYIAKIIIDLYKDNFNINIYIDSNKFINPKDKMQFILDSLIINKDILKNDKIINIKKILYYVEDINNNIPITKIIQNIFEIGIFLCKDINELKNIINQYIDFIIFIIIISIRILPENINNKKIQFDTKLNDNDINNINQDTIFFSFLFLYEFISTNIFLKNNKNEKNEIINKFNELLYFCFLIYQNGLNQKINKKCFISNSPVFYFFQYFFIKDENESKEKKIDNLLKNNLDNIYNLIAKDIFMQERFYNYGNYYSKKNNLRFINSDVLINCAKSRLENDTGNYHHNYIKNVNFAIDFENVKEKGVKFIKNIIKIEIINIFENSNEILKTKRNYYKSLKKKLFIFNLPWSNIELFYKEKKRLKYKILNHYTKSFIRPFLIPILDTNYYSPKFSKFDERKLYNNNDIEKPKYKKVCLDIDKILKSDNENNNNDAFSFINNLSKEENTNDKEYICCLVKTTHHIKGTFCLTEQGILFKNNINNLNNDIKDDFYDDIKNSCFGSYFSIYPKDKNILYITISYNKISYVFKRLYYYNETGLEIFTTSNKNYYFNFKKAEIRDDIYKVLLIKSENKINKNNLDSIINNWKNYSISNIELLMWLNIFSDRSYNDINQYPVLPWILSDYNSEIINDKIFFECKKDSNDKIFRDLSLPLGMIDTNDNGIRKAEYMNNLSYSIKQNQENSIILMGNYALSEKPYNYGSHYSNPIYVTNFLSRLFPFSYILIELQGDKFDDPDRLFISVQSSYKGSTTHKGDVRELIPEFYTIPEIYYNLNNFDMGIRRNKEKVNNVKCPLWSEDNPYKFLTIINLAFESNYVSFNINNWIDLIYGYKQRGKEAEKCNNVFRFPSYADLVPINQMNKEEKIYFYRFAEFGICPRQLFKKPFEKRPKMKNYKEIIDKNNMAITLNINDKNRKIVGIFPLEKEGIKVLFNDFSGIDFIKEKIKENVFKYIKIDFYYSHGLILNDNLIGNSKLDLDQIPFCLYNNGKYLIEGGFINGEMVISDLINSKGYLLFNDYDHSPINEIKINNEETIGIAGNLLGIIYIYKIKEYFWDYKIKLNIHNQKINSIYISDELNAFISCSDDNYINIFSFPSCKVINSFYVEKPEIVLLSSRPLNICITYSNKNQNLMVFSVNGNLIKEIKQVKKPEYPTIYTNKYFRDYLIFANNGKIIIMSLPYLEIIDKIQLIDEKLYNEFDLFLKYYQNKSKNIENLIACDRIRQIIYIIGDN